MFGYIGEYAGSSGDVTVNGAGSTWTNNGRLYVGRAETVAAVCKRARTNVQKRIAKLRKKNTRAWVIAHMLVDEGMVENDGKFDPLENTEIGKKIYE